MTGGTAGRRRAVGIAVVALLVLVGCSPPRHQAPVTPTTPPAVPADVGPELADFYTQVPQWTECDGPMQCADVRVPLDWADPTGDEITVRIARIPASGTRVGSLVINPGGPGASGIELLEQSRLVFGDRLFESFDVVGLDPRGVGESHPVECLDDAGKDALFSRDFDYGTADGLTEALEAWEKFGSACATNTGPLLGHVDTVSAARDLDVVRAAVGDETLSYLGFSYGTLLGATYAGLFPERAGRLVLDGGLDPTLDGHRLELGQARGFESALRAYVANCQKKSDCPLTGTVADGLEQIGTLVDRARRSPLPTSDPARGLTATMLSYGIAVTLYDQRSWFLLTEALREALGEGEASSFLFLNDFYFDRDTSGRYTSNAIEAFYAINCADGRGDATPERMAAEAAEILEVAPTMGEFFSYGAVVCARWPTPPQELEVDHAAAGSPPILVIGTTNDPATPYEWSESLAQLLDSGVLLTFEGEGHTAYGRSNRCIADAVESFLVEGTVPAEGTRC